MTEKEMKKLSRADLLELLLQARRENDQLQSEVERLKKRLTDRSIAIQNAGSIAEASLQLSGIFEAAQEAAEQYLENIRTLSGRQKKICEQMEAKTLAKCNALEAETKKRCEKMVQKANEESTASWRNFSENMEELYKMRKGVHEMKPSDSLRNDKNEA